MATSGTTSFNLTAAALLDQGYARIGGEDTTAVGGKYGIVQINLLLAELSNRGINLWTVDRQYINLLVGTGRYRVPDDTIDIENATIRQQVSGLTRREVTLSNPFSVVIGLPTVTVVDVEHGALPGDTVTFSGAASVGGLSLNASYIILTVADENTYTFSAGTNATSTQLAGGGAAVSAIYIGYSELPLQSVSRDDFAFQPNKYIQGTSYAYWFQRQISPYITLLFIPNTADTQYVYYRTARIQDVTSANQTLQIPFRFMPAVVSGMAYYLADLRSVGGNAIPIDRRMELQARYEAELGRAIEEDVELAPLRLEPDFSSYYRP